jgi:hypothetical protein
VNERDAIEAQIRELLSADLDSVTLSNKLFQQGSGLFGRLGKTEEERRTIVKSELWQLAQGRLRELEKRDLERFREVVKAVEQHRPPGSYVLRLEPADQPK